jgi:hypothetical protein
LQGLPGIGFKIPKGMVEVEKHMFILSCSHWTKFILQTYYSFMFFTSVGSIGLPAIKQNQYECGDHRRQ